MLVHTDRFLSDKDNAKRNQTNSIVTYRLLVLSALLAIPALRNDASLELTNADWFPQGGQDAMMMGFISLNPVPLPKPCHKDGQIASTNTCNGRHDWFDVVQWNRT